MKLSGSRSQDQHVPGASENCFSAFPLHYKLNADISEVPIKRSCLYFFNLPAFFWAGFNFLPILLSKGDNYTPRQF